MFHLPNQFFQDELNLILKFYMVLEPMSKSPIIYIYAPNRIVLGVMGCIEKNISHTCLRKT